MLHMWTPTSLIQKKMDMWNRMPHHDLGDDSYEVAKNGYNVSKITSWCLYHRFAILQK